MSHIDLASSLLGLADLTDAKLIDTNPYDARLAGATLNGTDFTDVNFKYFTLTGPRAALLGATVNCNDLKGLTVEPRILQETGIAC
ncbi:pentapeptide repeat-containing protein [Longispora sp. NPDC051575]|uniref:pentapeptide repeat-containing protein n=1 Tax=Longispora sp. NPDC051575 TaxID=3154943 RepID=UPI00344A6B40